LEQGREAVEARLEELSSIDGCLVLFDTLNDRHLELIGEVISSVQKREGKPLFMVGSSGVESALAKEEGPPRRENSKRKAEEPSAKWRAGLPAVERAVVVSGSCSPVTGRQIEWSATRGFAEVPLDTAALLRMTNLDADLDRLPSDVRTHLNAGQSVIVHTSRGPQDPRLVARQNLAASPDETAERLGVILGRILGDVLRTSDVRRVAVVGGDTSGYVAEALGIEALEMAGPLAPGVPLCLARSADPAIDGIEIAFKGGQVGGEDFFHRLLSGGRAAD